MIVFSCPHCGNGFEVADTYAGRDGWCRRCKQMVTVPARSGSPLHDTAAADNYARLQAAFQYAAGKADQYETLYDKARGEQESLAFELRTMTERLAAIDLRLADAEATLELTKSVPDLSRRETAVSVEDALKPVEQRLARLEADGDRMAEQIASFSQASQENEKRFGDVWRDFERMRSDLGEEHTHRVSMAESLERTGTELGQVREGISGQAALLLSVAEALGKDLEAERAARSEVGARLGDDQADAARRLSALEERIDALTAVEQELVRMAGDVEHAQATGQQIASSLTDLGESLSSIQSHAAINTGEVERLASLLTELRNQLEADRVAREETLDPLRDRVAAVDKRIEDLNTEVGSLRMQIDRAVEYARALQGEVVEGEGPRLEEYQGRGAGDSEVVVLSEVVEDDARVSQQTLLGSFLRFIDPSQRQPGPDGR